jgi:ethanolamine ammonia-lyase small subunit
LGKIGVSVPLKEALNFIMANAFVRDAMFTLLEEEKLIYTSQNFQLAVYNLQSKTGRNACKGLTGGNCIFNTRLEGLSYAVAAQKIVYLVQQSLQLKLSVV